MAFSARAATKTTLDSEAAPIESFTLSRGDPINRPSVDIDQSFNAWPRVTLDSGRLVASQPSGALACCGKFSMASFMRSSATASRFVICSASLRRSASHRRPYAMASMLGEGCSTASADVRSNAAVPAASWQLLADKKKGGLR